MDALVNGCLATVVIYMVGGWVTMLGIVMLGSRNPGWLQVLADAMDEPPPVEMTEREFLFALACSWAVVWPLLLAMLLSSDGPWRG